MVGSGTMPISRFCSSKILRINSLSTNRSVGVFSPMSATQGPSPFVTSGDDAGGEEVVLWSDALVQHQLARLLGCGCRVRHEAHLPILLVDDLEDRFHVK